MAELPSVLPGPLPDGLFGVRGLKRNRGIIEQLSERILGDDAAAATLENIGQASQVEVLIDQGMRARTRAEQRPIMAALSQIADSMGLFERDMFLADDYDAAINESIMAAASFVGPEQKEELAQLADQQSRAWQRSQFQPTEGLADMQAVSEKVLELTGQAGDRIRTDFIEPLRELELEMSGVRQQLLDSSQGNMTAMATPQEVLQVLNILNTQTSQEFGGINIAVPFVGGISPDDVPNMTYGELMNAMTSHLKGTADYVNAQLAERGADIIAQAPARLVPTPRSDLISTRTAVEEAVNDAMGEGTDEVLRDSTFGMGNDNAVTRWMQALPAGTQLDAENFIATAPDGTQFRPPGSARALLEQVRRRRSQRRVNE